MEPDRPRHVSRRWFSDWLEADALALAIERGTAGCCVRPRAITCVVFHAGRRARWRWVLRGHPLDPTPHSFSDNRLARTAVTVPLSGPVKLHELPFEVESHPSHPARRHPANDRRVGAQPASQTTCTYSKILKLSISRKFPSNFCDAIGSGDK